MDAQIVKYIVVGVLGALLIEGLFGPIETLVITIVKLWRREVE